MSAILSSEKLLGAEEPGKELNDPSSIDGVVAVASLVVFCI